MKKKMLGLTLVVFMIFVSGMNAGAEEAKPEAKPEAKAEGKPEAKPVTLEYVRWMAANAPVPWFAIGGINLQTIDAVLEAGASRVCVVSAILNAPDVAKACAAFKLKLR